MEEEKVISTTQEDQLPSTDVKEEAPSTMVEDEKAPSTVVDEEKAASTVVDEERIASTVSLTTGLGMKIEEEELLDESEEYEEGLIYTILIYLFFTSCLSFFNNLLNDFTLQKHLFEFFFMSSEL